VGRSGDAALRPLARFAHVEKDRRAALVQRTSLVDVDLGAELARGPGHWFKKDSEARPGYCRRVSPRTRVIAIVASLAATAAVVTVGATVLASSNDKKPSARAAAPRAGAPPIVLDLGVRDDAEARALRRAAALHARGRRAEAARAFARWSYVDAKVGAAIASWPDRTLERLQALERSYPTNAVVKLHLGFARYWLRENAGAVAAWRAAERTEPDSASAVRAGDLLHPEMARGLPVFVAGFEAPRSFNELTPRKQLDALWRGSRSVRGKLLYGVALQRLGKPLSARRQFDEAASLAPSNAEAQVAAAVARFDKDDPSQAFSRLGPLARRFPRAPTVRFHLGLLLLWIARVDEAKLQLERARALGPRTPIGREANRFLERLDRNRR
jgi:tetratricopeptide (TPR) repeat protein